jgi:DNA-directed RNA polymerase specialized sigma24 family protein
MEQLDLLTYPNSPGYKRAGTSKRAAKAMKPRAPTLRDRCVALVKVDELTTDEAAALLGETVLAIRPRFSEALRLGLIRDTGKTRPNASGVQATVWGHP